MAEKQTASSTKKALGYLGGLAFLVGFILAVVGGIVSRDLVRGNVVNNENIVLVLLILGIVVAVLNISAKEIVPILIAAAALLLTRSADLVILNNVAEGFGTTLQSIVQYLATFMVPVAVISAIKVVIALARPD